MNHAENNSDSDDSKPLLEKKHVTSFLKLLTYGGIIVSPSILNGMSMNYSAIALPQLKLSISDASWFGSIYNLGAPIGAIIIGLIIDKFGRRPSFLVTVLPSVIGWLLLCLDFNRWITFTGRILTGVTGGCLYLGQVYSAECIVVNHPHWRNTLNNWQGIGSTLGMLLDYALGLMFSYHTIAIAGATLSFILLLVVYLLIPESPRWLYHQGLLKEARNSEQILGIHQPILRHVDSVEIPFDSNIMSYYSKMLKKLTRKDVYKPLIVMTVLYILLMSSGGPPIIAYLVDIIRVGSNSETIQPYKSMKHFYREGFFNQTSQIVDTMDYQLGLIASLLVLVAVILVAFAVHFIGMKKIYFLSSLFVTLSYAVLSVSLRDFGDEYQHLLDFFHVASVWSICFFYFFGVISVMTAILGEVFPHDAKGFASIPAIIMCLMATVALKLHPYLLIYCGSDLYMIYAGINVLSIIFVFFFIPETLGKSLEEVGEYFSK